MANPKQKEKIKKIVFAAVVIILFLSLVLPLFLGY